jgi:hypothetical protein
MMLGAAVALLVPLVNACSDGGLTLQTPNMLRPDALSFSGQKETFTLPPPGPEELVNSSGQCAASAGAEPSGGIALQMSECDVVRRAGPPDDLELGATPGGERAVVLKYLRGPRAGIYRFTGGRLVSIERAPDAPGTTAKAKKRA